MFNIPPSKRLRRICSSLTNQSIYLAMGCPNNKGMCQVRVLQKVSKTKTVGALVWKSFTHHAEYMVNTEIAYRRYWTSINPSRVGELYPSYSCSKPYTTQQWTGRNCGGAPVARKPKTATMASKGAIEGPDGTGASIGQQCQYPLGS